MALSFPPPLSSLSLSQARKAQRPRQPASPSSGALWQITPSKSNAQTAVAILLVKNLRGRSTGLRNSDPIKNPNTNLGWSRSWCSAMGCGVSTEDGDGSAGTGGGNGGGNGGSTQADEPVPTQADICYAVGVAALYMQANGLVHACLCVTAAVCLIGGVVLMTHLIFFFFFFFFFFFLLIRHAA